MGFLGSSAGKESACNAADSSLIPGLESSPEEGIGYPLQYSWAFLVANTVKEFLPAIRKPGFDPWVGKVLWRRAWHPLQYSCLENPHGQRSLAGFSPWGHKRVRHD